MMFVDPHGEAWYEWGWIDTAANFCAGVADDLTLGGSNLLRDGLGWNDNVDKDSGAYSGGGYTAAAAGMFTPTGFVKGVGKAAAKGVAAKAGKKTGSIYKVPGEATASGKPYIGRHNKPDPAKTRRSKDGRDRKQAEVVDRYDPSNRMEGRLKEQAQMDAHGGLPNLDNKRNEICR